MLSEDTSQLIFVRIIIVVFIFVQALESFSTLIIKFRDEEEKATWSRGLIQATYRASVRCYDLFAYLCLFFLHPIYIKYKTTC